MYRQSNTTNKVTTPTHRQVWVHIQPKEREAIDITTYQKSRQIERAIYLPHQQLTLLSCISIPMRAVPRCNTKKYRTDGKYRKYRKYRTDKKHGTDEKDRMDRFIHMPPVYTTREESSSWTTPLL